MIAATRYTPPALLFDPLRHDYTLNGQTLLHVTGCLTDAALIDRSFFTDDDRRRGSRVHAAIERRVCDLRFVEDDDTRPFLRGFERFLVETGFRVDASEERLADAQLMVAGTLDLRGQFSDATAHERVDVIDVKTGATPAWVGFQLAGYVRLLPLDVRPRARRWSLTLRADGTYRLLPHSKPNDERVFLASVVIALAKRGWL